MAHLAVCVVLVFPENGHGVEVDTFNLLGVGHAREMVVVFWGGWRAPKMLQAKYVRIMRRSGRTNKTLTLDL